MAKVTKDMTIMDALAVDANIASILMGKGMHCIYCAAASGETLEEAFYVHGYSPEDADNIIAEINDFISGGEAAGAQA